MPVGWQSFLTSWRGRRRGGNDMGARPWEAVKAGDTGRRSPPRGHIGAAPRRQPLRADIAAASARRAEVPEVGCRPKMLAAGTCFKAPYSAHCVGRPVRGAILALPAGGAVGTRIRRQGGVGGRAQGALSGRRHIRWRFLFAGRRQMVTPPNAAHTTSRAAPAGFGKAASKLMYGK